MAVKWSVILSRRLISLRFMEKFTSPNFLYKNECIYSHRPEVLYITVDR